MNSEKTLGPIYFGPEQKSILEQLRAYEIRLSETANNAVLVLDVAARTALQLMLSGWLSVREFHNVTRRIERHLQATITTKV